MKLFGAKCGIIARNPASFAPKGLTLETRLPKRSERRPLFRLFGGEIRKLLCTAPIKKTLVHVPCQNKRSWGRYAPTQVFRDGCPGY